MEFSSSQFQQVRRFEAHVCDSLTRTVLCMEKFSENASAKPSTALEDDSGSTVDRLYRALVPLLAPASVSLTERLKILQKGQALADKEVASFIKQRSGDLTAELDRSTRRRKKLVEVRLDSTLCLFAQSSA